MKTIVECVPNFSGKPGPMARAVEETAGVYLLGQTYDSDHNRSVLTFAGSPEAVVEAALAAAAKAFETIDLSKHTGVHPRIGAMDVCPFVAVSGITIEECASFAVRAGEEIWRRFGVPVFLYEAAARKPEHINLADIRKNIRILAPDIGVLPFHPTAGAVVVGARKFLVAFNVNLDSPSLDAAKSIAKAVRESSGGLRNVKALGLTLASRNLAQVSMNLTDFEVTGIAATFQAVEGEARRLGIGILESELIGLAPAAALNEEIARRVKLRDFNRDMIFETRLARMEAGARLH